MGYSYRDPSAASGWVIFAGVILFTIGCFDIIMGLAALFSDNVYAVTENGLLVTTNYDAWGWALIIWGGLLILTAVGLFSGEGWARWLALIVVVVNLVGIFAWFPAYPLWALSVILLSVGVIYGLTAGWKDVERDISRA